MFVNYFVFCCFIVAGVFSTTNAESKDWWETASFYQIYPRSWKDSDGDGVGDLNGITANLAYLKEIGITATWLSPIFTSPMADFGYDISNFTDIDPIFGTMDDFDKLMAKAKEVGVKIILDFVPNHSSDECEWFIKSAQRDPEYKDFYVWHPGKIIDGVRHPPSNWMSVFRGRAWTFHEVRQEYYLHQFHYKQPDFNYRNPKVRQTLKEILRFWLKKGISGYRIDAIPFCFEIETDAEGNYADEPPGWSNDPEDYGYVNHIYTIDHPDTFDLVYEWRQIMDEFQEEFNTETKVIMAETYSTLDNVMKYYGNGTVDGAHIPFNFQMIMGLHQNSNANDYASNINNWFNHMPKGRTANWVMGNHDQNRIGSRLGADRMDMINMILNTLPGCAITYQGEEIGMLDVFISWNDTVDPQACNSSPEDYADKSRDPARTPFQWNNRENAGFTMGSETWLPMSDNYEYVNVMSERGVSKSHLNIYKQLKQLRHENAMKYGDYEIKALNDDVFAIKRFIADDYIYITLANIMDNFQTVDLTKHFDNISHQLDYVVVNGKSSHRIGERATAASIQLLPKEAVILRTHHKLA